MDFSSIKYRRIVRSVLGLETFGLADAVTWLAIVIQNDLKQILKKRLKINILIDRETLFNIIIRNSTTTELRIIKDLKAAREDCNEFVIDDVLWIRRT